MKLLAISHGLGLGGAQLSTLEFLELLKDRVEVKVLTCDNAVNSFTQGLRNLGLEVYKVTCLRKLNYPIMLYNPSVEKLVKWADIIWITDIEFTIAYQIKEIKKNIPIVAHLHSYALVCPWWGAYYSFRETCTRRCSIRRIIQCKLGINNELSKVGYLNKRKACIYNGASFLKGPLDYTRWRQLVGDVVDNIDGFIAVSNSLWKIHVAHIPHLGNKPHVIIKNPSVMPLKYISPKPHEAYGNYIVYASGENPLKGPHVLLKAWVAVSKELKDLKLYMIRCKDTWVERQAKKLALKNITFTDYVPPKEHYELMYRAHAVVMPSLWPEPFGRIPIEANRLGVPAIVSDTGGLPEIIINGTTGFIFKRGDPSDLITKILKVFDLNFERQRIIDSSFEVVNPSKSLNQLLDFFRDITSSSKG